MIQEEEEELVLKSLDKNKIIQNILYKTNMQLRSKMFKPLIATNLKNNNLKKVLPL